MNQKLQLSTISGAEVEVIPWEPKTLSSEVDPLQLMEGKVIENLPRLTLKISTKIGGATSENHQRTF